MALLAAIAAAALAADAFAELTAPARGERPNFVVFMAEDLGPRVGAFGDAVAQTPNVDALAARGVRFTRAFTTAGVCAPARAAHIMGMHQVSFGAQHMRTSSYKESPYRAVPPPGAKAYPELLREAGYWTMTNRKLDYQFSAYGAGTGPSTIWDAEPANPDWSDLPPGRPFYFLVNLPQTHESRLFDENFAGGAGDAGGRVAAPSKVDVPPYYPDVPEVREAIARQYDNARRMDRAAGEVLARLEADGLLENTVVIWTTDHGDGLPRAKRELYDSGIHVPLVVAWPDGHGAGTVDDRLLSFVDLGPSILRLAGLSVPGSMQGLPVLADPALRREYVYAEKDRLDEFVYRERAVRDGRFKYLRNELPGYPGAEHLAYRDRLGIMQALWRLHEEGALPPAAERWFGPRPREELYDLAADPHEVHNLAGDPAFADELARLRAALDERLAAVDRWGEVPEAEMARAFWPGGVQPSTPPPVLRSTVDGIVPEPGVPAASLACRVADGPWRPCIEGAPFSLASGQALSVYNVRYGWQASAPVRHRF